MTLNNIKLKLKSFESATDEILEYMMIFWGICDNVGISTYGSQLIMVDEN